MKINTVYKLVIFLNIFLILQPSHSQDLYDAMSQAYVSSPHLKALRAKLKATDESISKILSEKRPVISLRGSVGTDKTTTTNSSNLESTKNNMPKSINLQLSQNLFDSGKVKSNLNKAENLVMAERAFLLAEEQKILLKTSEVYLQLFASKELLRLKKNNLKVLKQHFSATNSRFEVGEVTSTDLSQAEARYLRAKSDEIKARGDVRVQESIYFSIVGIEAPKTQIFPSKTPDLPNNLRDAIKIATKNNPNIVGNSFRKKASLFDISAAAADLLPSIDLSLNAENAWDPNTFFTEYQNYGVDLNINIPLYNGGYNYSNVREKRNLAISEARLLDDSIRVIVKDVEVIWLTLENLKFRLKAINASIEANQIALNGVREEAKVGTRTTLDVLDAEQELLEEKVELINSQTSYFNAAFQLIEKLGNLNPEFLKLKAKKYNAIKNYNSVKKLWLGFEPK